MLVTRLSNLEDKFDKWQQCELWKERRRLGCVNHSVLGVPCEVVRQPVRDSVSERESDHTVWNCCVVHVTLSHKQMHANYKHLLRAGALDGTINGLDLCVDRAELLELEHAEYNPVLCSRVGVASKHMYLMDHVTELMMREAGLNLGCFSRIDFQGVSMGGTAIWCWAKKPMHIDTWAERALALLEAANVQRIDIRVLEVFPLSARDARVLLDLKQACDIDDPKKTRASLQALKESLAEIHGTVKERIDYLQHLKSLRYHVSHGVDTSILRHLLVNV
jgi:hypothetical protein